MNIRASGRSALIIAAGLWVCFAGPLRATDSAAATSEKAAQNETAGTPVKLSKFSKHRSHHARKHVAHRHKSAKTASAAHSGKSEAANKTAGAITPDSDWQTPLPPTVANASAQMPGADSEPKTEADALASNAGKTLAANANQGDAAEPQGPAATADVVPSDQLNDVDRALTETRPAEPALAKPAEPALAMASVETPAAAAPAAETTEQASASEDSAWSQTSLIGKIFIAFGGLLTLASAARMFIA